MTSYNPDGKDEKRKQPYDPLDRIAGKDPLDRISTRKDPLDRIAWSDPLDDLEF